MELLDFLKREHESVSQLLTQLDDTSEATSDGRARLFDKVRMELGIHAAIEEAQLYPVLRELDETKDMIPDAIEEHQEVKDLLAEMSAMSVDDEGFTEKLEELTQAVEEHVAEEETGFIPAAEEALPAQRIADITRQLEQAKSAERKAA